jgi:hypothetical protein
MSEAIQPVMKGLSSFKEGLMLDFSSSVFWKLHRGDAGLRGKFVRLTDLRNGDLLVVCQGLVGTFRGLLTRFQKSPGLLHLQFLMSLQACKVLECTKIVPVSH